MPIIVTKTVILFTAATTTLGSLVGGGIAGDVDQSYTVAAQYAETRIERYVDDIVSDELGKINVRKYGTGGNL